MAPTWLLKTLRRSELDQEAMLLIQLRSFKWAPEPCYSFIGTLAARMGFKDPRQVTSIGPILRGG
jgi:hypothetical protein